jgi:hypothetical protein
MDSYDVGPNVEDLERYAMRLEDENALLAARVEYLKQVLKRHGIDA